MTTDDRIELARLIDAEADGQPLEGMVAVARVCLLRLAHWRQYRATSDSIEAVIAAPGQFESVANGRFAAITTPSEDAMTAVELALSGLDPCPGADFFYNPVIVRQRGGDWVAQHTRPLRLIGRHVFSKGGS